MRRSRVQLRLVDRRRRRRSHGALVVSAIAALFLAAGVADAAADGGAAIEQADELVPSASPEHDRQRQDLTADQDEGRRLYQEGLRAFAARDYDGAIEQLKASYAKTPAPALLYNLGQACRLKGDCPQALAFYRQFLATNPVGRARERAEARIADMERCVAVMTASANAAPPPARPTPAIAAVAAPAPTANGVDVATRAPGARRHGWHRRGVSLAVTAAVLASASGYFAWRAGSAADQVSGSFVPMSTWTMAGRDAENTGVFSERMAIGTGVGALLAAGLATWAWWEAK